MKKRNAIKIGGGYTRHNYNIKLPHICGESGIDARNEYWLHLGEVESIWKNLPSGFTRDKDHREIGDFDLIFYKINSSKPHIEIWKKKSLKEINSFLKIVLQEIEKLQEQPIANIVVDTLNHELGMPKKLREKVKDIEDAYKECGPVVGGYKLEWENRGYAVYPEVEQIFYICNETNDETIFASHIARQTIDFDAWVSDVIADAQTRLEDMIGEWEIVKNKEWSRPYKEEDYYVSLPEKYLKIRHKGTGEVRVYRSWAVFDGKSVFSRGRYEKKGDEFEWVSIPESEWDELDKKIKEKWGLEIWIM